MKIVHGKLILRRHALRLLVPLIIQLLGQLGGRLLGSLRRHLLGHLRGHLVLRLLILLIHLGHHRVKWREHHHVWIHVHSREKIHISHLIPLCHIFKLTQILVFHKILKILGLSVHKGHFAGNLRDRILRTFLDNWSYFLNSILPLIQGFFVAFDGIVIVFLQSFT